MNPALWHDLGWLIIVHVVTPFVPFAFPVRVAVTAGLAMKYNWWLIGSIATVTSTASLVAQYFIFRRLGATNWIEKIERSSKARWLLNKFRSQTFLLMILLSATPLPETVMPLMASAQKYSAWRFAAAMLIGRLIHIIPLALGGASVNWLWQWLASKG